LQVYHIAKIVRRTGKRKAENGKLKTKTEKPTVGTKTEGDRGAKFKNDTPKEHQQELTAYSNPSSLETDN